MKHNVKSSLDFDSPILSNKGLKPNLKTIIISSDAVEFVYSRKIFNIIIKLLFKFFKFKCIRYVTVVYYDLHMLPVTTSEVTTGSPLTGVLVPLPSTCRGTSCGGGV